MVKRAEQRAYLEEIKGTEWVRFFTRGHHPLLYVDSVMRAHRGLFHSYLGLPKITHWVRHSGALWVDKNEMNIILAQIRTKLLTNWPRRILAKMKSDLLTLNRYADMTKGDYTLGKLQHAFRLMYPAWISTYFPIMIGKVIEDEVVTLIGNKSSSEQERLGKLLNTPLYPSVRQEYVSALRMMKKKPSRKDVDAIIKRFGWINGYVMDVRNLSSADVVKDWQRLRHSVSASGAGVHISNSNLRRLITLGRAYCWFRDWRLFQIGKFFWLYKSVFEHQAKSLNLTYQEFTQLRVEELFSSKFQRSTIKKRQEEFSILLLNSDILVKTGAELKWIKKHICEKIDNTGIVKGITASAGRVTGRVRIVDSYSFSKIKKGEIVVTAETTPDAVPYIRRAKAIVADEGGITSHAAIISRELKIPCVIGTKIATRVFKGGDLVEVDANKGTVIKL